MHRKSLNQVLAENLRTLMAANGWTESSLGKKAGVAPNTIGNYCEEEPQYTSSGKERSAKLAEIEKIAEALGVHPLQLLTDPAESARRVAEIAALLAGTQAVPLPAPRKRNGTTG